MVHLHLVDQEGRLDKQLQQALQIVIIIQLAAAAVAVATMAVAVVVEPVLLADQQTEPVVLDRMVA